jgi:hypothetical protein
MQNFNSFTSVIKEATSLGAGEMIKPNSRTGELRIDILKRLILAKTPLELAKGGTFVVKDIESALQSIETFKKDEKNFALKGDGEKFIMSNHLAKSKVFGGGFGGAGSGTKDTQRNECHQAAMCQAYLDHGMHDFDFFDDKIIAQSFKQTKTDSNEAQILETPENWWESSYASMVVLVKGGYLNKSQTFHRGDKQMIKLYAMKNEAYKNNGFKPLKDDKWNPGDIWAIAKDFNMDKELDTSSVGALNKKLLEHFNTKRLVGISLKQSSIKAAPIVELNNEYPPDTDVHKITKLMLESKGGDFWSSKGATIVYDDGAMTLKDNANGEAVKAEIKGKKARGGGISWGGMQEFMKRETGKILPPHAKGIKGLAKKIDKGSKRELKLFWTMFNHFYKNVKYEDFVEELNKKDWFWISAKLGCMYVLYYLDTNAGTKANNVITHFVNYAGSKSLDSSVYVKVGK